MLCTHVNYDFPFQQPSTTCGTYATLLVYRLATSTTYQLKSSLRYYNLLVISECNYYLLLLLLQLLLLNRYYYYHHYYYLYNAILHVVRKPVLSLLSPYIMLLSLIVGVNIIITMCVLLLYLMYKRLYILTIRYMRDISIVNIFISKQKQITALTLRPT